LILIKIIAGKHKNKHINTPKSSSARPTSSRLRETIFNILKHSKSVNVKINNLDVIDLFAGSGALGLEALSRGCKRCIFIDNSIDSIKTITNNIKKLNEEKNARVIKLDANTPNKEEYDYNLCFIDPPYDFKNIANIIEKWSNSGWLKNDTIYIYEKRKNTNFHLSNNFQIIESRIEGISEILFFKKI